jgi:hypothetical protein
VSGSPRTSKARPTHVRVASDRSATADARTTRGRGTKARILSVTRIEIPAVPEHILFIGNSLTDRHGGMDWLVGNLVGSEQTPRAYDGARETASGVTLEYHYRNGAIERIRDGDWDVVVLQEYLPGMASKTTAPFYEYARLFDEAIRSSGARTVLYMTWPDDAHPWADLDVFVDAYRHASLELGAPVAPVGVAMARARAERPELELMDPDRVHATWAGAYLAAATIYATLYERTPEGLSFHLGVSDEDAAFLQRIAWQTVTDWQTGEDMTPATPSELATTTEPTVAG